MPELRAADECAVAVNAGINAGVIAGIEGDRVMLFSLGSCSHSTAVSLISQICGYSTQDAQLIVQSVPVTIAQNLTDAQARALAQALSEYGLEVAVYDAMGWREMESDTSSVWDSAGSLIVGAAAVLGLIGVKNRIGRDMMHRWDYPHRFSGPRPPVYRLNRALPIQTRPPVRSVHAPVRPAVAPCRAVKTRSASGPNRPRGGGTPGGPGEHREHGKGGPGR